MSQPRTIEKDDRDDWREIFLGREEELAWLKQNWQEVYENSGTRICVLRGESGFGKTRIIQKFYSWLSQSDTFDPEGYWPDNLRQDGDNLKVNPRFDNLMPGESTKIPWLWWGIRWEDPERRNQGESDPCEFINYTGAIAAHKETITARIQNRQMLKNTALVIADIATPFIETLSGYGFIKATYDGLKTAKEAFVTSKERKKTVEERQNQTQEKLLEDIVDFFDFMLDERVKSNDILPLILILDDVHWVDDMSLKNILAPLLKRAIEKKRALLVIATSWEKEWHEQSEQKSNSFPKMFQQLTGNVCRFY